MLQTTHLTRLFLLAAIIMVASNCSESTKQQISPSLSEGFQDPPVSARPWAYWVWMNGVFNYAQLKSDLEDIKEKGMGGFDILDIGERFPETGEVPAGPEFLGKESLEAIHYAIKEAGRLGLELGLIASSSWNAGGSWVKPEHANMALFSTEPLFVKGPGSFSEKLPFPSFPEKAPQGPDGLPVFYKEIAVLAYPVEGDTTLIKDISSIKDISKLMSKDGMLQWDIPEGEWAIVRLICTNTGKMLHAPSLNSGGLVIDHFNPAATEMHFQTIIDKLHTEMESFENTALKYLYLCSYEVWGISWTPDFQQEFMKRRGYDINPYLPVMLGLTIQDEELTKRFYYDFQKTICDLIVDAHYANATRISNKYGLELCSESGGPGPVPVEALKALGALDIPRGEFWYGSRTSLVKEIACASHIYGKKIVDQEAYTSWLMWQEAPCDLKGITDNSFCNGMNKVTFHTYAHNPPEAGIPGWPYWAGTHIGPNRVWWPKVKPFMDYLSRCSYLLREGLFVGDVCYYYGDQGYNYVPEKHIDPSLGYGYDYDVTNAEVILTRMEAKNGRVVLPDGMSYELLVLPDREDIDLDVLKKLEQLVKAGITLVGRKPLRTNGLTDYPNRDEEVRKLAEQIWGPCDGETVKENKYGKGTIIWGLKLSEILQERGIGLDFSFTSSSDATNLDYIHRTTGKEEIYFVSNKNKTWEDVNCTFRVKGKIPELWDPENGEMMKCPVYNAVEGGTMVSLKLPPQGSVFVVFREKASGGHIVSVKKENSVLFPVSEGPAINDRTMEIRTSDDGNVELLAWQEGTYTIETDGKKNESIKVDNIPGDIELSGPWEVRFPGGWGAPESKIFQELISWTDDPEDGIKYFSGIAAYHKEFEISEDLTSDDKKIILDLGSVMRIADVYLNGRHVGILWKSPFCADITKAVKPGKNNLVIEVANTWSNRLTGDGNLPENMRRTKTNMKHVGGPLRKGYLWKDAPLLQSGLLGPVKLVIAEKRQIEIN